MILSYAAVVKEVSDVVPARPMCCIGLASKADPENAQCVERT